MFMQAGAAAAAREMDAAGALAVLCGRRVRFLIRRTCVSIGRSTDSHGPVRSPPSAVRHVCVLSVLLKRTRQASVLTWRRLWKQQCWGVAGA